MVEELKAKYNIPIYFKYVPTGENPADLLIRGLSIEKFKSNIEFCVHGPTWIRSDSVVWPTSELQCLSENNKIFILHTRVGVGRTIDPIVLFERYSKFTKLVGVTSKMLEAMFKFK